MKAQPAGPVTTTMTAAVWINAGSAGRLSPLVTTVNKLTLGLASAAVCVSVHVCYLGYITMIMKQHA